MSTWAARHRRFALVGVGLAAGVAAIVVSVASGDAGRDVSAPWRVWGRVSQLGVRPDGAVELPNGFADAADGAPVLARYSYRGTRTPRLPAWRCAGLCFVDVERGGRSLLDRVLRRDPGWIATYAPSGAGRAGAACSWREYVRTFEEDEPWRPLPAPELVGAWDLSRGRSAPRRIELRADGTVTGLGDGAEWGSRDGVVVLRVRDARSRTGVRYDSVAEHDGAWTGWGDDGAAIEMHGVAAPR